jgi:hypothetical protein
MKITSIEGMYCIRTDESDWPVSLPEVERRFLVDLVRRELAQAPSGMAVHELSESVRRKMSGEERAALPVFANGVVYDWIHACVERAARACDAETVLILRK